MMFPSFLNSNFQTSNFKMKILPNQSHTWQHSGFCSPKDICGQRISISTSMDLEMLEDMHIHVFIKICKDSFHPHLVTTSKILDDSIKKLFYNPMILLNFTIQKKNIKFPTNIIFQGTRGGVCITKLSKLDSFTLKHLWQSLP